MNHSDFPHIAPGLEPGQAVNYQSAIKGELSTLAPELAELTRLAEREARILEAVAEFSDSKAKEDFTREAADLRANPTAKNIEKLKNLGSYEDRRAAYQAQHRALSLEAEKLRREAAPMIRAISIRLCRRLAEMSAQAQAEESAVFQKWGLPVPASRIASHFTRAQQEIRRHVESHERNHFPGTLAGWAKRFLAGAA